MCLKESSTPAGVLTQMGSQSTPPAGQPVLQRAFPPEDNSVFYGSPLVHLSDKAVFLTLGGIDRRLVFGKCKVYIKSLPIYKQWLNTDNTAFSEVSMISTFYLRNTSTGLTCIFREGRFHTGFSQLQIFASHIILMGT